MNEIFEEIKRDMDDFFQEIDKAIGRDPEEVDVITDHLPDPMDDDEAEYWEMKAEIHNGIQGLETNRIQDTRRADITMDICRVPDNDDIR